MTQTLNGCQTWVTNLLQFSNKGNYVTNLLHFSIQLYILEVKEENLELFCTNQNNALNSLFIFSYEGKAFYIPAV